jgi:hypothetical protein
MILPEKEGKQKRVFVSLLLIATLVYLGFDMSKFNNEKSSIFPFLYDAKYTHVPAYLPHFGFPLFHMPFRSACNDFYRAKRKKNFN